MATARIGATLAELGENLAQLTSLIERLELAYGEADDDDKEVTYTMFAEKIRPALVSFLECIDRTLMNAPHRRRH